MRASAISLASRQSGLITLGQLSRRHHYRSLPSVVRALEADGELESVYKDVWVHTAAGRAPVGDLVLGAQARWLALIPHLTLRERNASRGTTIAVPVIGGSAAWSLWGLEPLAWTMKLHVPGELDDVRLDDQVELVMESVDSVDVVWHNQFPYLRPEALLAEAYGETGDLDRVAAALSAAMWRLHPLRPDILKKHILVVADENGWTTSSWNADTIYDRLVLLAGGWPRRR